MRILLDECLPRRFGRLLCGHDVYTVAQIGWTGLKNGALLARIGDFFEAFVTIDKNLPAQHPVSSLAFGIVVLRAPSNRLQDLAPLAPRVLDALAVIRPGQSLMIFS